MFAILATCQPPYDYVALVFERTWLLFIWPVVVYGKI